MTMVDSTMIDLVPHGVAATKGHISGQGGLRGHSVGDIFPYIVFAQGNPHVVGGLRWRIRKPDGSVVGDYRHASTAHTIAKSMKESEATDETKN